MGRNLEKSMFPSSPSTLSSASRFRTDSNRLLRNSGTLSESRSSGYEPRRLDILTLSLSTNWSYDLTDMPFRSRAMTGLEFFSGSPFLMSDISRSSNHVLPAYLRLRYASSMLRLVLFPNLRGRVKRNTSVLLFRMLSISLDLST